MSHRTLKLTHEEIQRIEWALDYVWSSRLDYVYKAGNLLDKDSKDTIVKNAERYSSLVNDIQDGQKDV